MRKLYSGAKKNYFELKRQKPKSYRSDQDEFIINLIKKIIVLKGIIQNILYPQCILFL